MKINKKILSIFFIALLAIVLVGCDGDATSEVTTDPVTTEAPTTDEATTTEGQTTEAPSTDEVTTEAPTTGDGTTETPTTGDTPTTTEEQTPQPTTTEEQTTQTSGDGSAPTFVGLFTNQTYYRGSRDYDILEGVKAMDAEDGDITANIEEYGRYSLTRVGTYEIYVGIEDSDGNYVERLVTITVKDLNAYTIPDTLTSENIEISLWHSNGATIENALMGYAEDFMTLYPNITVNIIKSGNNYDELRENVINAIRGGELPNIVQNYPDHVMEYIDNAAVVPLTPFMYHPTHGYNPDVTEESLLDIVLSYRKENSQYTPDGEYYSVPFNKSTEVMIYNKTIMDALVADGTLDAIPDVWTWQMLFDLADDMERVAVQEGIIDQIVANLNLSTNEAEHKTAEELQSIKDNFVPIAYDSPANAFITLTRQWGGQYTGLGSDRVGQILFDNPQTREAMSYFYDHRDDGQTAGAFTIPGRWGTEYASDSFKMGQTAVTFGSTGGARYNTPSTVNGEYVFEFGVAPMPYNADMPENRTAIQQGTNMSITSAGTDQQKLASWLFLKYLTSYEVQLDFALETGYSPVRNSVYTDSTYINFTNGNDSEGTPLAGEMLMKSKAAQAAAMQADYLFYDQAFVGSSDARAAVEDAFGRIILGTDGTKQEIIDDAIAAAKSKAEQVLE
jgi:ABC-type glycerol-3-phosphate transport system substrate-binding protein